MRAEKPNARIIAGIAMLLAGVSFVLTFIMLQQTRRHEERIDLANIPHVQRDSDNESVIVGFNGDLAELAIVPEDIPETFGKFICCGPTTGYIIDEETRRVLSDQGVREQYTRDISSESSDSTIVMIAQRFDSVSGATEAFTESKDSLRRIQQISANISGRHQSLSSFSSLGGDNIYTVEMIETRSGSQQSWHVDIADKNILFVFALRLPVETTTEAVEGILGKWSKRLRSL